MTALPCVWDGGRLRTAEAGDGVAAALLSRLADVSGGLDPDFQLDRFEVLRLDSTDERDLGTDQSNISVVVGEAAIVKWRSAPDADGRRATRLRRHLQANGFRLRDDVIRDALARAVGESWP